MTKTRRIVGILRAVGAAAGQENGDENRPFVFRGDVVRRDMLWGGGPVVVKIPPGAEFATTAGGRCVCIRWNAKGARCWLHVYGEEITAHTGKTHGGGRRCGNLEVWEKTFQDGSTEIYLDARLIEGRPTHRAVLHSTADQYRGENPEFSHNVGGGILVVEKLLPQYEKPQE